MVLMTVSLEMVLIEALVIIHGIDGEVGGQDIDGGFGGQSWYWW